MPGGVDPDGKGDFLASIGCGHFAPPRCERPVSAGSTYGYGRRTPTKAVQQAGSDRGNRLHRRGDGEGSVEPSSVNDEYDLT